MTGASGAELGGPRCGEQVGARAAAYIYFLGHARYVEHRKACSCVMRICSFLNVLHVHYAVKVSVLCSKIKSGSQTSMEIQC